MRTNSICNERFFSFQHHSVVFSQGTMIFTYIRNHTVIYTLGIFLSLCMLDVRAHFWYDIISIIFLKTRHNSTYVLWGNSRESFFVWFSFINRWSRILTLHIYLECSSNLENLILLSKKISICLISFALLVSVEY